MSFKFSTIFVPIPYTWDNESSLQQMIFYKWCTVSSPLPVTVFLSKCSFFLHPFLSLLAVCSLFLFLGLAGLLLLHLIFECTQGKDITFSSASLEVSLCWLPSGSGGIFFRSSAVCCPLLVDGVQMPVAPMSEQTVSTPGGWEMYFTWEGRKSVSLEEFLFSGNISVQENLFLSSTILHTLMNASLAKPIRF